MSDAPTIAVVGAGPAARAVVRLLADSSVRPVHCRAGGPSIWSVWSGFGSIYGPPTSFPPSTAGAIEKRRSHSPAFDPAREDRWQRLAERRGAGHPYARLGAGPQDIERTVAQVLETFPDGLFQTTDDAVVRPGPRGAPAVPDVLFPSLQHLALQRGATVAFVCAHALRGWHAAAIAEQVGRADGVATGVSEVAPFDGLRSEHPVRAARELRELGEVADTLGDAVVAAASEHDADLVILPPVVGATLDEHAEWWDSFKLAAAHYGARVAEFPAARDSMFGWRLREALRGDRSSSAATFDGELASLRMVGNRLRALVDAKGREVPVDGAVLATGRWFSGGLPSRAPFVEPLSGAPIWLDGAPLPETSALFPPDRLEKVPWADHELMRAGLETDDQLRVLDRGGEPFENLFAAGRILGGFNPFQDGCSLGVELATAARAAVAAAEFGGASSPPSTTDSKESR